MSPEPVVLMKVYPESHGVFSFDPSLFSLLFNYLLIGEKLTKITVLIDYISQYSVTRNSHIYVNEIVDAPLLIATC